MEPEPTPPQPDHSDPITADHLPESEPNNAPTSASHKPKSFIRKLGRVVFIIIVTLGSLLFLAYMFATPTKITLGPGSFLVIESLQTSEYALVEKVSKYFRQPQIGDLVLFDNYAEFNAQISMPFIGVVYEIVDEDNIRTYKAKVRPTAPGWEFTQEKIFGYAYYPKISQSDIDLLVQTQPPPEPTPTPTPTPDNTANWQSLESDNYPINLRYPLDWIHHPNANNDVVNLPYTPGFSETNETLVRSKQLRYSYRLWR